MMTSHRRLFMWTPQPWPRSLIASLTVYPWERYRWTRIGCQRSILSSDWINASSRWVMRAPRNALFRLLPEAWSQWPRTAWAGGAR